VSEIFSKYEPCYFIIGMIGATRTSSKRTVIRIEETGDIERQFNVGKSR
jgi:hypothetical protein